MSVDSGGLPSATTYVCSQLRDETKLPLISQCPVIAFAKNVPRFLEYTYTDLVRHVTKVVVLKKGDTLDKLEEASLAEIEDALEEKGARNVQIDVRLPDDSSWE